MRKYQFGDSNTDFFNMLADRYAQQFNQTEDSTPEYTVDENQSPDDAPDYQDLLDKYGDLESRFNQLSDQVQSGLPYGQSYNDNFLDFLFSDDNKLPIDFSNEDLSGSTKSSNSGFRTFDNYQEGRNALENQLDLYKTGRTRNPVTPNSTLYEAMNVYAPAADHNNPKAYAEFIAKKLGVSPNTPISKLDTKKWADAVEQMEGNKTGHNPGNLRYQFGGYKSYNPNAAKNDLNFQTWYNKYTIEGRHDIPFTEHLDYDYYSYYKNGDYMNYDGGHFPDTYKRPNHPTFSNESIYSIPENTGGHWQGNKFIPAKRMQSGGPTVDSPEDLIRGLNNPYYAQMKQLNLKLPRQQNLIRGLDNNKPVSITDELGNTGILKGKNDKKYFFGSVHEKIL